ncbi:PAS domain-containing sensor histidine kinase [Natrarchaeobaculum aegyptiacum]|uniref:histidine kinase n=1 Tax=Natrarchaeobaculum aegyptiacum TaxID=745377 RepID=A0A2Z2HXH5_9EURY|nr:PAS domain-containing sensor histidine kinase [Natrarchaeobaculum aegyptiacum]ARS91593.1 hypothetical protein B1756_18940 [Natrarchaeobaculum aegyptiacum]
MDCHRALVEYLGGEDPASRVSTFFEQMVEGVGVGVGAVGEHGRFVYVNERYADLVGRSRADLVGAEVGDVNPDLDQSRFDDYWKSFSMGETRVYEGAHRTSRGDEIPIQVHVTRVEIAGSEFNVGTIKDVTELRQRREQLDVLRRVLRHDLRNRLNVVSGYVELIELQLDGDDELRDHFEQIQSEIEHLLATSENSRRLEELLDATVAGSDSERTALDLHGLLEDAVATTRKKFPEATISYDPLDAESTSVRVLAAEFLGQAITHVLSNAVIHNDAADPRVEVTTRVRGDRVLLSIADNGPGIDDDRKDLVFGREERDQLHHGRGFGLFFVGNVVEKSGGEIWIDDNDPRGAIFRIELPLER